MTAKDNQPILVGAGQHTWRDIDFTRTPTDALEVAARQALDDCHCSAIEQAIDALVNVRFVADTNPGAGALFPRRPAAEVARRLGIENPALYLGPIGGNTPQYLVNHFARMLMTGEHRAVLLSGAELMATFFAALKQGGDIAHWADPGQAEPTAIGEERDGLTAQELAHGLYEPINTYPLFENALRHHLGHDLSRHSADIAELSSRMSAVAADNAHAWRQDAYTAEEIATVARNNRYVGYPYTRRMNALLEVDMAAAIVMTTVGTARALGIPEEQWIYYRGGVDLHDIWYPSERPELHSSPAIKLGWETLTANSGLGLDDITHFDIYSCFPSAVEIGCHAIGLSPLDARNVTVTGGLPYFGGPGNNYSLHAIAQMTESLRSTPDGNGLVTANGLYLTKHSLGLYSKLPGDELPEAVTPAALQESIERGPRVKVANNPEGEAIVETYTVAFDRDGPRQGILVARNAAGERIIANSKNDPTTLEQLLETDPIGQRGRIHIDGDLSIMEL